jgi:hypothetical protein
MADTVIQPEVEANAGYVLSITSFSALGVLFEVFLRDFHRGVDVQSGAWWMSRLDRRGSFSDAERVQNSLRRIMS